MLQVPELEGGGCSVAGERSSVRAGAHGAGHRGRRGPRLGRKQVLPGLSFQSLVDFIFLEVCFNLVEVWIERDSELDP